MCKREENRKTRLYVLLRILENKKILFGEFNDKLTKTDTMRVWKEVGEYAKSIGIVPNNKEWSYIRDVWWPNIRRLTMMDNACFQDDSIIEMENVRLEERNGNIAEKEKIAVSFENTTYAKIDVPETGVNQNNKQRSEACQPQLCQEVSKHYQKAMETNRNFDPMLKLKAVLFFIICLTLFIWCLIHFIAINSPTN